MVKSGQPGWTRLGRPAAGAAGLLVAVVAVALLGIGFIAAVAVAGHRAAKAEPPPLAPPFSLSVLGHPGQHVTLASYSGRPVVINFFASWCHACKTETPLLASFYRAEHGRVLVIGIDASDRSAAALSFLRAERVSYPVGYDGQANVALSYGIIALPQTVFLNARHHIVRHVVGGLTRRELDSWAASLARPGRT